MTVLKSISRYGLVFSVVAAAVLLAACPKGWIQKPPEEEVAKQSSTVRLSGYQQMVTVRGPLDEVSNYISQPANLKLKMLRLGEGEQLPFTDGHSPPLGSHFTVSMKMMGLEIKGLLIVVKSEAEKRWMVVDNPWAYMIQRWDLEPAADSTVIKLKMDYEVPESMLTRQMEKLVDPADLARKALAEIDLALARLQAHFDPSLDPDELTAVGLRGEEYDSLLQVYEGSILVDAKPRQVVEKVFSDPGNIAVFIPDLRVDSAVFAEKKLAGLKVNEVIYSPAALRLAGLDVDIDTFTNRLENSASRQTYRFYLVGLGIVMRVEIRAEAEGTGSRVSARIVSEIPTGMTSGTMDLLFFISDIPDRMDFALRAVKSHVEGGGQDAKEKGAPQ